MITNLHHVAILTSNLVEAINYYTDLLDCQKPKIADVDKPGVKLKSAMLPIGPGGNTFLQIIEPELGPGVKELTEGGEGTLFEMAFETDNIEEFADKMLVGKITPCNIAEQSINEKYITSKFGSRYFILSGKSLRGTRIEIVQMITSQ